MRAAPGLALGAALAALGATGCRSCSQDEGGAGAAPIASISAPPDAAPMTAIPVPAASVEESLNPDHLPAYSGPAGSVEGTIYVTGLPPAESPADFSRCPAAAEMYGKTFREGAPKTLPDAGAGPRPLADAIVQIVGYTGYYVRENAEAKRVTIEGCGFSTRTVTMTFGQKLEILNRTSDFWTPILDTQRHDIMMMAPPNAKDPVIIYPKRAGAHRLADRDRKYATAVVWAFRHPLHTESAADGHYRIDGIPAGKLKINALHPAISNETVQDVEIKPGQITRVDLTIDNRPHPVADGGTDAAAAGDAAPSRPVDSHP